ncbi:MAG: excinuclease ABC subunit UvrC, partial [Helicobacteraceae bacterium]|nr:excinuclease ABC subunit UvrC [Helicobacteraceae bacterium]
MITKIKNLPKSPGIYQYFDKNNKLLYVGKAKSLFHRVKSYFLFTPELRPNPKLSPRIVKMLSETTSMHYIIVNSEHDALILENSLIKQLKPKYNILLRDDKTYPYIYIDTTESYPRFEITRKVLKGKNIQYFGPYSIGARDILDSIYELCKLVQKKSCLKGKKACLYYQMDQCLAPCEKKVSTALYSGIVKEAMYYIENKKFLIDKLKEKMAFYAENLRFEEAGMLRDRIERISKSELISQIDLASTEDYDIFAISYNEKRAVIVRLFMRAGKIISSTHGFINLNSGFDIDEAYERALLEFYGQEKPPVIAPILVAHDFGEKRLVQKHLSLLFEKKAIITLPQRGNKKHLIELALTNAVELLRQKRGDTIEDIAKPLQELLSLDSTPRRIEAFDNSHMAGEATVGGMITFDGDNFDKSGYRHYHLAARDEYGQMRETLTRRIQSFEENPPPDLWLIDGGRTLLALAKELLDSAGVNLDVIAISKEKIDAKSHRAKGSAHDQLHTSTESFKLAPSDKRLQWMQRLRDEAHRYAITFHKKTKLKKDQASKLLNTHGISQAKVVKLLQHFGTFDSLKNASLEDITVILNQ